LETPSFGVSPSSHFRRLAFEPYNLLFRAVLRRESKTTLVGAVMLSVSGLLPTKA
jgi:hypothetical protein